MTLSGECVPLGKSYLSGRRVRVNSHRAGGGRNWAEPVTGHRNIGRCSERIAHFFAVFMTRCGCAGRPTFFVESAADPDVQIASVSTTVAHRTDKPHRRLNLFPILML